MSRRGLISLCCLAMAVAVTLVSATPLRDRSPLRALANTASVDGQVFEDTDYNGQCDLWEARLPGIEVALLGDTNDDGQIDLVDFAVTDQRGRYRFGGLGPGRYAVSENASWETEFLQTKPGQPEFGYQFVVNRSGVLVPLFGFFGAFDFGIVPTDAIWSASDSTIAMGESTQVFGEDVQAWAQVDGTQGVTAVGVSFPYSMIENTPVSGGLGNGPAQAVAVLDFPSIVRDTTFFNHFEMQWQPVGHEPEGIFTYPHYDLHFYGVPPGEVWNVRADRSSLPRPTFRQIPSGYLPSLSNLLYIETIIPEMGYHAFPPEIFNPFYYFREVLLYGYYQGEMTFIEPMITREFLEGAGMRGYTAEVPLPAKLSRATRYPTRLVVLFDGVEYHIVYTDFVAG